MLRSILSVLLLAAFAKVGQTESALVIRPRALSDHATIAAQYSEEISALHKNIILEDQIAQIRIEANITALENLVNLAAAEKRQDIEILQSTIKLQAQKPAASSGYPRTCLRLQTLYAETLNTEALDKCVPTNATVNNLEDAQLDIIRLEPPVTTLVQSCQLLNPIASQAAAMKQCVVNNLDQLNVKLTSNVVRVNSLLRQVSDTTIDCVYDQKKTLDQQIANIHIATTLCFI